MPIFGLPRGPSAEGVPFWNRSGGDSDALVNPFSYFPGSNSPACEPLGGVIPR